MPTYPGRDAFTEPRARSTDPQTSHDAGAAVDAGRQRDRIMDRLNWHYRVDNLPRDGFTADELDEYISSKDPTWLRTTAGRRLSELNRRELVIPCGQRKTRSGRMATVYRINK